MVVVVVVVMAVIVAATAAGVGSLAVTTLGSQAAALDTLRAHAHLLTPAYITARRNTTVMLDQRHVSAQKAISGHCVRACMPGRVR